MNKETRLKTAQGTWRENWPAGLNETWWPHDRWTASLAACKDSPRGLATIWQTNCGCILPFSFLNRGPIRLSLMVVPDLGNDQDLLGINYGFIDDWLKGQAVAGVDGVMVGYSLEKNDPAVVKITAAVVRQAQIPLTPSLSQPLVMPFARDVGVNLLRLPVDVEDLDNGSAVVFGGSDRLKAYHAALLAGAGAVLTAHRQARGESKRFRGLRRDAHCGSIHWYTWAVGEALTKMSRLILEL